MRGLKNLALPFVLDRPRVSPHLESCLLVAEFPKLLLEPILHAFDAANLSWIDELDQEC